MGPDQKRTTILLSLGGAASVILATFLTLRMPEYMTYLVGAIALIVIFAFARISAARIGITAVVVMIAIPLIPGLQEARSPQFIAYFAALLALFASAVSLAHRRATRIGAAWWCLLVPIALSAVSLGLINPDPVRIIFGGVIGGLLGVGVAVGRISTRTETRRIVMGITAIGILAALVACVEYAMQRPLYEFTAFQSSLNTRAAFRSSAVFGHPLVLAVSMLTVAFMNITRPRVSGPWWFKQRLVTVALPLIGAAASVSRSAIVILAVGLIVVVIARMDSDVPQFRRGFSVLIALASGAAIFFAIADPGGAFAQRFGDLSSAEQSVRLSAFDVAAHVSAGSPIIGRGPRSVGDLFQQGDPSVRFGTLDNQFATAFADFGFIGLIGLILLALTLISAVRSRKIGSWSRALAIGGFAPLMAMFFLDPLPWPSIGILFALSVGAALNRSADITSGEAAPSPSPGMGRLAASATKR